MSKKPAKASYAQAKALAVLFGKDTTSRVYGPGGYNPPTLTALVRNGWIIPTEKTGVSANGTPYVEYKISHGGLEALERSLWAYRIEGYPPE